MAKAATAGGPSQLDAMRAFIEQAPLAVAVTDRDFRFMMVSPQWVAVMGLRREEMIGKTTYEAMPPTRQYARLHQQVLRGRAIAGGPEGMVLPSGEVRWLNWTANPWRDGSGRIGGMLIVSHDVTAQVEAEGEARRSRALAAMVVEHSPFPMVLKGADGRVVMMNRAMQRLYSISDDHRGRTVHQIMDPAAAAAIIEEDRRALESGETMVIEERLALPGLEGERVLRKTKAAIRDADGAAYLLAISEDITDSRRTQDELEKTRAFLEAVIQSMPSGITVKDASTGRLLITNPAAQEIFARAANIGKTNEEVFPPEQAAAFAKQDGEVIASGGTHVFEDQPVETPEGVKFLRRKKLVIHNSDGPDYLLSISEDVTERKRTQDSLKDALARAEAASVAKSEFLANMSHEIRTPLNGVLGLADVLARMELTAQQRDIVGMIVSSGKALTGILSDVLDLAKAEAGQLQLAAECFSLRETIGSAAFLFQTVALDKGIGFSVAFDPDAPDRLVGDPLRIRQVVSNLISNAVKFTSEGEVSIRVGAEPSADGRAWLSVEVRDSGPGFSEEVRSRLFSRFEQGDGSITRRYGGSGLGLSIAGALAQMMDGEIDCSATPGQGAAFVFRAPLPVDATPRATAAAPEARPLSLDARLRVLLAEDHEVNQKVVQLMLADAVELVIVGDGEAAVAHALGGGFDVVLMDTQMPVMDGLTATRLIREREAQLGRARIPIVSLTANAMDHQVQAALEAGADLHLPKPITADALYGAIQEVLQTGAAGREASAA